MICTLGILIFLVLWYNFFVMYMNDRKRCILSIILLLVVQMALYYIVKLFQGPPHLIGSKLDSVFPFCKYFVFVYDSWYPFLILVWYKLYMNDKNSYKRFYIASVISMVIANIIFILYPSTIERALFKVNDVASFVLNITYSLDTPVNCLPSMHCMFCFTTIYGIINSKLSYRNKLFFCLYLVLIVFSTLFIKQHVIYDVILSFIISIVCFYVSKFKIFDKLKEYL